MHLMWERFLVSHILVQAISVDLLSHLLWKVPRSLSHPFNKFLYEHSIILIVPLQLTRRTKRYNEKGNSLLARKSCKIKSCKRQSAGAREMSFGRIYSHCSSYFFHAYTQMAGVERMHLQRTTAAVLARLRYSKALRTHHPYVSDFHQHVGIDVYLQV